MNLMEKLGMTPPIKIVHVCWLSTKMIKGPILKGPRRGTNEERRN